LGEGGLAGQRVAGGGRAYQCLVGAGETLEEVTVQEQRARGQWCCVQQYSHLMTNDVVSSIERGVDRAKNQGGGQ